MQKKVTEEKLENNKEHKTKETIKTNKRSSTRATGKVAKDKAGKQSSLRTGSEESKRNTAKVVEKAGSAEVRSVEKSAAERSKEKERVMLISVGEDKCVHVAIVDSNNRLLEYSLEISHNKPIRGNIYLANVIHVETSLQAAFVDFGGKRNGFLPFSEIQPHYYQLPQEAKEAILKQIREKTRRIEQITTIEPHAVVRLQSDSEGSPLTTDEHYLDGKTVAENLKNGIKRATLRRDIDKARVILEHEVMDFEADEDFLQDDDRGAKPQLINEQKYHINEVIKSGQLMLVQVVREARGEKGATLTTNISLPSRYTILMPYLNRGICTSRKIWPLSERTRLKRMVAGIGLPENVSFILRTAANGQKLQEIKRDCDGQLKLWEQITDLTVKSNAPMLIYEDCNQLRKAIRDLYNENIVKIIIDNQASYQEFCKMMQDMVPGGSKRVALYQGETSLFHAYQIQKQIAELYQKRVTLKSGATLVIQSTEAVVAIDVNSGKSTQENNIEETALKTNLEAAEEIARQVNLRNLGGIIVIDFIDMKQASHNRKVEQALKLAFSKDLVKLQFGSIDHFGVMLISRQRMSLSKQEISAEECFSCSGNGYVFAPDFASWLVLEALEDGLQQKKDVPHDQVQLSLPSAIAMHLLNCRRPQLAGLEERFNTKIILQIDDKLSHPNYYNIEISSAVNGVKEVKNNAQKPPQRRRKFAKKPVSAKKKAGGQESGKTPSKETKAPASNAGKPARGKSRSRRGAKPKADTAT